MKRTHLFEFEDLDWFPSYIRDGGTDFLGFILKISNFYSPAAALLNQAIINIGHSTILDLCSGNGDTVKFIDGRLNPELNIEFILSDKFPNINAYKKVKTESKNRIQHLNSPLDVLDMNDDIDAFRTMFAAIHHFKEVEVKHILKQIIQRKSPIAIFDCGDKHILTLIGILIFHPILFLFLTPFIRPFNLSRLFFTYLIPLIPLYTIWDGVVSIMI